MTTRTTTRRIDPRMRDRRVAVKRAAGRRRLRVLAVALVVLVLLGLGVAALWSPLLAVDAVAVTGVEEPFASEAADASGVRAGQPIAFVDLGGAARAVEEVPWVASATVRRDLPRTIRIEVTTRTPVAFARDPGGATALVDATGRVVGTTPSPPAALPELVGLRALPGPGGDVEPADVAGVRDALPAELAGRVRAVVVGEEAGATAATLRIDEGPEIRLGRIEDLAAKGAAALAVLGALGGDTPAYVDVRVPSAPTTGG